MRYKTHCSTLKLFIATIANEKLANNVDSFGYCAVGLLELGTPSKTYLMSLQILVKFVRNPIRK